MWMTLSVVIPVLNEEKTINKILIKVLKQKSAVEVIVIDDGSTDRTLEVLKNFSKTNKKIKLLRHKKNLGKGAAVINGLKKVSSDYLLIQDADLEYNPDEYIKLVSKVSADTVVYGSRMIKKNTHAYERTYIGNLVLTYICNFLFGTKLTDSYTCYKLLPTKIAKKLNLKSQGFELEAEITAKLAKKKINIFEVPISYSPRKYEEGKKIKALDALKGVFTLLRIKFTNY